MFKSSLWNCLRHPITGLIAFDQSKPQLINIPYATWLSLTAIAVGGSILYGASLAVIPNWHIGEGAMLLTASAGLAWCVFGPVLVLITKPNSFTAAHACLITMAYGEAVLAIGAAINFLLWQAPDLSWGGPATFNLAWVGLSNIVMMLALSSQLAALKIPFWKTILIWMVALNGSGLLFFLAFAKLLARGT